MLKRLRSPKILIPVVVLIVVAVGAFGMLHGIGPLTLNINVGSGSKAEAAPKVPEHGVPVSLGERVVNLADPGGFRYLKAEVVLELLNPEVDPDKLTADQLKQKQTELQASLSPRQAEIQDVLTMVLSSKTVDQVTSPQGKEALKQELKDRLQPLITKYQIKAVYFAQFVIQ
jgi:flagellar FliL protein